MKHLNTLAMIYALVVGMVLLSWIVPSGEYARVTENGRTMVVPDSYRRVSSEPLGLDAALTAPVKGFVKAAEIIVFLFIVGGTFNVLQSTGAVEAGVRRLAGFLAQRPNRRRLFIPVFMVLFSAGGTIFGMCEETMPFVLIFVPLSLSLGYDTIVGTAIPFLGAAAGFAAAVINPFTVGIASSIAELPLAAGFRYRLFIWVISTLFTILFVMRYAAKIEKNPAASPTFALDEQKRRAGVNTDLGAAPLTPRLRGVLIAVGLAFPILIYGVLAHHWFIIEMAGFFLALAMAAAFIAGLSIDEFTDSFKAGAKEMIGVALIIACARALLVIAEEAKILDTFLHAASFFIAKLPPVFAAQAMFIAQAVINFFVHSGSGQAMLTMPVMTPLADVIGISRQAAVLAFVFGEGWINPILPTSGVTMGVLGLAGIPWSKWAKWMLPLQIFFFIVALLLLIPPVLYFGR